MMELYNNCIYMMYILFIVLELHRYILYSGRRSEEKEKEKGGLI